MNGLEVIERNNAEFFGGKDTSKPVTGFRELADGSVLLSSAKSRGLRYLTKLVDIKNFKLRYWGTNSADKQAEVVESYFVSATAAV